MPVTAFPGLDPPEVWPPARAWPRLDRPVATLHGVGPSLAKRLAKLGLGTLADLVVHRPFRYEEPAPERRIADLFADEEAVIAGEVVSVNERRRGRLRILTATVDDGSDRIRATWFNQPWLARQLRTGRRVRLRGRRSRYGFDVRSFDLDGAEATADFAPVYPASEELTAKKLRELIGAALPRWLPDPIPTDVLVRRDLPGRGDALWAVHRPRSLAEAEAGRRRLAFDELLALQIGIARRARERETTRAAPLGEPGELVARYRKLLPFELTPHQEEAIRQIDADLAEAVPMQRLLQGDVGSGKTVVALYALLRAVENGHQGALMAPTETLAEQHFLTVEPICAELGVRVGLLTGSVKGRGEDAQLVVGT
jgi:ATP-dependent DNA helicase RecG